MTDLALGQVINGRFHFIGNSGWSLFEDPKAVPAARNVTILSTQLCPSPIVLVLNPQPFTRDP
jgi:hypothetical protein